MTDSEAAQRAAEAELDVDNDLVELREGAGSVSTLQVSQILTIIAAPFTIGFFITFEAIN